MKMISGPTTLGRIQCSFCATVFEYDKSDVWTGRREDCIYRESMSWFSYLERHTLQTFDVTKVQCPSCKLDIVLSEKFIEKYDIAIDTDDIMDYGRRIT